jgi:hypothetical protein
MAHIWLDIVIVALLAAGVYCFAVLTGFERRFMTRKTDRRAEDLYDRYTDSPRKQRRLAREHEAASREDSVRPGSAR